MIFSFNCADTLSRFDDHELAHHPLIFVLQPVAVVHIRRIRVALVGARRFEAWIKPREIALSPPSGLLPKPWWGYPPRES